MDFYLLVTSPFLGYAVGEMITDPSAISSILASEYEVYVIRAAIE